jgi:1,4-dihydroxy-2-naphthoyl-CoA hydrolase
MIWFKPYTLDDLLRFDARRPTLARHLGIEFVELGPDFVRARMPVAEHTHQPDGLLHGGASVALAETVASVGANLCVDPSRYRCFGQEINANHVRSVTEGHVDGIARPLHLGRRSHVWEVRIADGRDRLVCIARMTAAVVEIAAST